jgi:hypothetical protein
MTPSPSPLHQRIAFFFANVRSMSIRVHPWLKSNQKPTDTGQKMKSTIDLSCERTTVRRLASSPVLAQSKLVQPNPDKSNSLQGRKSLLSIFVTLYPKKVHNFPSGTKKSITFFSLNAQQSHLKVKVAVKPFRQHSQPQAFAC